MSCLLVCHGDLWLQLLQCNFWLERLFGTLDLCIPSHFMLPILKHAPI